jgi:hypothetical protein
VKVFGAAEDLKPRGADCDAELPYRDEDSGPNHIHCSQYTIGYTLVKHFLACLEAKIAHDQPKIAENKRYKLK